MPRPVRFRGRVIQARESRGPQNKEFTRDDLLKLIPSLKGVQLMYNHGDDKEIGGKAIGKIEQAYLDDEGYLVVRGVTDDGSAIGAEVFERIRNELLDSTIPMLSIHWTAQTLNQTKVEAEKIANPDAKVVKEISLVKQGYYPEANIIEVQCSADRLRWKTDGGIYTESEAATTAKPTLQHRMAERHDLLFNKFAKLSDEAKADLAAHPEKVADMYADIVPEMWKELSGYKQKEKRERDAYSVNSAKEFEETYEKVKDAFPEDTRESTKAMLLGMAQDYDGREKWQNLKPLFGRVVDQSSKLAEFEKLKASMPAPAITPQPEGSMAMAASLERGRAHQQGYEQASKRLAAGDDAFAGVPTMGDEMENHFRAIFAKKQAMRI